MLHTAPGKRLMRPVFGCEPENIADVVHTHRLLDSVTAAPQPRDAA